MAIEQKRQAAHTDVTICAKPCRQAFENVIIREFGEHLSDVAQTFGSLGSICRVLNRIVKVYRQTRDR